MEAKAMTNEEKKQQIKKILGPDYENVVVLAANAKNSNVERVLVLNDADQGAMAGMMLTALENFPQATSLVKFGIPHLTSDPIADILAPILLGGKD